MSASNGGSPLRIILADDHQIVRAGVRLLLEQQPGWTVCAEVRTGREAVAAAAECKPQVAILDIMLPELDGVEAMRQIKRLDPSIEVVVFTAQTEEGLIQTVFEAGARSVIFKSDDSVELLTAVRAAAEHQAYFTSRVSQIVFARLVHPSSRAEPAQPGSPLTAREHEVLALVGAGLSNKDVAERLHLSLRTVESHRAAVMQKLGLKTVGDLVRYAVRNKIVEP